LKPETKPEEFHRELLALMHAIHGKWTRAYTIVECFGIESRSRPEELLNFQPPPELAGSPYASRLTALWWEAQKCAQQVKDDIDQSVQNWSDSDEEAEEKRRKGEPILGIDFNDVWWTYQNWPDFAACEKLWAIVGVSRSEAEARLPVDEAVNNAAELIRKFKSTHGRLPSGLEQIALHRLPLAQDANAEWLAKYLRRRDGAGRTKGKTKIPKNDYPIRRDTAIKDFTSRMGRPPSVAELCEELGIDKKTYYGYENRANRPNSQ